MLILAPQSGGEPEVPSTAPLDFHDRQVEHHRLAKARQETLARRRSTRTREAGSASTTHYGKASSLDTAVDRVCNDLNTGRLTLASLEASVEHDEDRLRGWEEVPPLQGSTGAAVVAEIERGLKIKRRAAEKYQDLNGALVRPTHG